MARKLAGEISPLEMDELEILLKENPSDHLKIQALTELWNQDNHFSDIATDKDYQQHLAKLRDNNILLANDDHGTLNEELVIEKRGRKNRLSVVVIVGLIVAAIGTYYFIINENKTAPVAKIETPNTISTKYGSRTKVELPDGSTVWLNSGSKLTYDKQFGNSLREVHLTGEGFFDVVHNEEKPFIIHTAYFDIKDLGTQFNVKCYPEDKTTETSLVEGSIEIVVKKRPNEKWILKPDEKLVLLNEIVGKDTSSSMVLKNSNAANEPLIALKKLRYLPEDSFALETAWTYNKLSFDDETFVEVAKKMERWYAAAFEFRNKKQEEIHISGSFVTESLEQAMEALKYTNRFNYTIKEGKVIIY